MKIIWLIMREATRWPFIPLYACIVGIAVGVGLGSSLIVLAAALCLIPAATITIGLSDR